METERGPVGGRPSRPAADRRLVDLPSPLELARLRREVMSQKEMAVLIGVDTAQLSRFERGASGMAYERIRRYVHVLNLRLAAEDPHRFLVERIANRGPLWELRPHDTLEKAIETMVLHEVGQLPVLAPRREDHLGVLTEVVVAEALVAADPQEALMRPVGGLRLEPFDVVRPGDSLQRVAALLASHWLLRVEAHDGALIGFVSRGDLFPLVLGRPSAAGRAGSARRRSAR